MTSLDPLSIRLRTSGVVHGRITARPDQSTPDSGYRCVPVRPCLGNAIAHLLSVGTFTEPNCVGRLFGHHGCGADSCTNADFPYTLHIYRRDFTIAKAPSMITNIG